MALVKGFDPALSGQQPETGGGEPVPVGVWGDSNTGTGVFGTTGVLPPGVVIPIDTPAGVEGHGVNGPGVAARSVMDTALTARSQQGLGVLAQSEASSGVLGVSFGPAGPGIAAVVGSSTTGTNGVLGFVGDATGVIGSTQGGIGVRASANTGTGVFAETFAGAGPAVHGESDGGVGCEGVTFGNGTFGVRGRHISGGDGAGVFGASLVRAGASGSSLVGNGVEGSTLADTRFFPDTAAIRGENSRGLAGLFVGRVRVTGFLSKGGGGFLVDHPLDPANKVLSHSFVESPEMLNVYSGTVTTDQHGSALVKLPHYFEALNRDFRYQLTVIRGFARATIHQEIKGNEFEIKTDAPHVKVCWQVTGVRKDAWAEAHRIVDEEDKPAAQRGRYLHPELFKSEAGIHAVSTERSLLERISPLEDTQRENVERLIADATAHGQTDTSKLTGRLSELRKASEKRAAAGKARLDQEWRRLQDLIAKARAKPARK
jgi:hypothetical protein